MAEANKKATKTKTKKVNVDVAITEISTAKKATKAEEKAQNAKKRVATKKTAEKIAQEKSKKTKLANESKSKLEKETKAKLETLKKAAESSKKRVTKITETKSKISSLKVNKVKNVNEQQFTKVILLDFDNTKLPEKLFNSSKIYGQAIFDTIMSERASRRQGTHDVKNRSEVSGTGKKPWRQKGTGRARAGSLRSPIFVGGGRAFGPTPERNYTLKVNKKVKKAAFVSALTSLAKSKSVVIDDFKLKSVSTKDAVKKLESLKIQNLKHILFVTDDELVYKSVRNLPNVVCVKPNSVLVEQLVWADVLVLSNEGLKTFEGRVK